MNNSGPIIENQYGFVAAPLPDNKKKIPLLQLVLIVVSAVELVAIVLLVVLYMAKPTATNDDNYSASTYDGPYGEEVKLKTTSVSDHTVPLGFYAAASLGLDSVRSTLNIEALNNIATDYVGLYGGTPLNLSSASDITSISAGVVQNEYYPYEPLRKISIGTVSNSCATFVFYPSFETLYSYTMSSTPCS